MSKSTFGNTPPGRGEVRIRSNISTDPGAVHLIPGTLLRSYFPDRSPSPAQRAEQEFLHVCTLCKRRTFEINEHGCDYDTCRRQGILSTAEAAARNVELGRAAAAAVDFGGAGPRRHQE